MSLFTPARHTKLIIFLLLCTSSLTYQPLLQSAPLNRLISLSFTAWWLQALDREYFQVKYQDFSAVKRSERNLVVKNGLRQLRQDAHIIWQANVQVAERAYTQLEKLLS